MNGENPYAPPQTEELESWDYYTHRTWIIYSGVLLVRKGTTLPHVDLDNGDHENAIHPIELGPSKFFKRSADSVHAFSCKRQRYNRFMEKYGNLLFLGLPLIFILSSFSGIQLSGAYWLYFILLIIPRGFGRSKLVIEESAKRGWLRISKVHPQALHYLRGIARYVSEPSRKHTNGS